ncbi:MAG: hypothetical protein SGPRY_012480, partial [Prymnesium sp.]
QHGLTAWPVAKQLKGGQLVGSCVASAHGDFATLESTLLKRLMWLQGVQSIVRRLWSRNPSSARE